MARFCVLVCEFPWDSEISEGGAARILASIFCLLLQVGCNEDKYDNYDLIRLYPYTEQQVKIANIFRDPKDQIEIFKTSRGQNDSVDLLVPRSRLEFTKEFANESDLGFELKQTHYGRNLEYTQRVPRRRTLRSFNVFEYNSFVAINDYLETLARRHPDLLQLEYEGNSYQGRRLKLAKISSNPHARNPVIFIDAGIHAREWVAPAMAIYLIDRLVSDPEAVEKQLDGVDWYILPVANPDGYEFTRLSKVNRLWRKTRSKTSASCYGVDGNRNYGFKWAVSGVSTNPCDKETYAGPKPFSEPETKIVRNIMMDNADRIKLYVSLHAYGNYLVYPWGYTGDYLPKQWRKLDTLARQVSNAINRAGGRPLKVMSAGKWYAAAGGSDDFAFGAVGVPYSYTMELTEGYEFVFPERSLREALPQFYEGFKVFGAEIKKEFGNEKN